MILLSTSNIEKYYFDQLLLTDISFNVNDGDKIGIVGINGCGKTTLFNILVGKILYDKGDIFKRSDLKIGYLTQNNLFNVENTLYEECLTVFQEIIDLHKRLRILEERMYDQDQLEITLKEYEKIQERIESSNGYAYDSNIRGVIKGLGFSEEDLKQKISTFSGGQKSRIQLAKLILSKPDLLMLDEPTNHLDLKAIEFLEGFLKDYEGACMIISHDRYFLNNIVNRIFHLENKELKSYETNYQGFMIQRKKYLEIQWKAYENQQRDLKRQEEIIERFTNNSKENLNKQGKSRLKQLEKIKRLDKPSTDSGKFNLKFSPHIQSGTDVLQIEHLSKQFDNKPVLKDITFNMYRGDRIGLIGDNGTGKTTLFKIIMDKKNQDDGTLKIGSQVNIGYFDQEQESLSPLNTVIDELWDAYPNLSYFEIRSYLGRFQFFEEDIFKEINLLSGGEKARLSLLKLMLSDSNVLLLDEPTNHLDIDSKEVLEDALLNYDGTTLVISHDRYFLNSICNKIIRIDNGTNKIYHGNYDYYIEKINEKIPLEKNVVITKTSIEKEKKRKKEIQRKLKEEKEICIEIENEIESVENELVTLQAKITNPEIYEDKEDMLSLFCNIDQLTKKKDDLYQKWENTLIKIEEIKGLTNY